MLTVTPLITRDDAKRAFTLVEFLVVMGIMSLLVALLIPAVHQARQAAQRTECFDRLRQLGLAMQNYHSTHGLFPPGGVHLTTATPGMVPRGDELQNARAPWAVLILPQLDEEPRYNAFDLNAPFSPRHDQAGQIPEPNRTQQYLPLLKYSCPSNPNTEWAGLFSCYAACQGGGTPDEAAEQSDNGTPRLFFDNGMFFHNSSIKIGDMTDGASHTVMIGETKYIGTPASFGSSDAWWSWAAGIRAGSRPSLFNISATCDPINLPQSGEYTEEQIRLKRAAWGHGGQQRVYGSWHSGGASFLMADGSVHFLNEKMDVAVYRALGKRADGQSVEF